MTTLIVLLQPPGACTRFTRSDSRYPPLGLCQLAAMTTPDEMRVMDADGEGWGAGATLAQILTEEARCVGMTATSHTLDLVEARARRPKAAGTRVIAGGQVQSAHAPRVACASSNYVYGQPAALPGTEGVALRRVNVYGRPMVQPVPECAQPTARGDEPRLGGHGHTFDFTHISDASLGIVALTESRAAEWPPRVQFDEGRARLGHALCDVLRGARAQEVVR